MEREKTTVKIWNQPAVSSSGWTLFWTSSKIWKQISLRGASKKFESRQSGSSGSPCRSQRLARATSLTSSTFAETSLANSKRWRRRNASQERRSCATLLRVLNTQLTSHCCVSLCQRFQGKKFYGPRKIIMKVFSCKVLFSNSNDTIQL